MFEPSSFLPHNERRVVWGTRRADELSPIEVLSSRAQSRDLRFLHAGYIVGLVQTSQVSKPARPGAPVFKLTTGN
jgi:hypothetical protein